MPGRPRPPASSPARRGQPAARATAARTSTASYSLGALVAELRDRAAQGEPQEALVEWLYALTAGLGIRMRYDMHELTPSPAKPTRGAAPRAPAQQPYPPSVAEAFASEDVFPALGQPGTPQSAAGGGGGAPPPQPRPAAHRGRREKPLRVSIPVTITRGQITVHFSDPALLSPRDPPADGRFTALCGETGPVVGRIILSCDRRSLRADMLSQPLCTECNGAVIDARSWTCLAIPPRAFALRAAPREVDAHLAADRYDIIQVSDGTVVTLYRWEHPARGPIWCLASGNGYDVSHLKWMGDLTYAEILHELLAANAEFVAATGLRLERDFLGAGDVRLGFEGLDPSVCYTVGFRHANFHPLGADPPGIWNIQSAELATGTPRHGAGGLPHVRRQATFTPADIRRLGGRAAGGPVTMADLDQIGRTALEDAKAAIARGSPLEFPPAPMGDGDVGHQQMMGHQHREGVHVTPFNYGFILRSRDPAVTGPVSDILCETALLRRVRQLVYQRPSRQVQDELDHSSRLEYSALKAFLTATDRDDFLALFAEFRPRFAEYGEFVSNVVHMVIHMHRQNSMAPSSRSEDGVLPRTRTTTIAKAMLTHILHHENNFKAFHSDAKSIVHDFVVRPEYAVLFLRAMGVGCGQR